MSIRGRKPQQLLDDVIEYKLGSYDGANVQKPSR